MRNKIEKIDNDLMIRLPKKVVTLLGLRSGDLIDIIVDSGVATVKKINSPKIMDTDLLKPYRGD